MTSIPITTPTPYPLVHSTLPTPTQDEFGTASNRCFVNQCLAPFDLAE